VGHRDGHTTGELAPLKKSTYSLVDLREILLGCNRRYRAFLSALEDNSSGQRLLGRITQAKHHGEHCYPGINFFDPDQQALLRAIQRPEFNLHGLRRAHLAARLSMFSPSQLSRQLRRLRELGLLKRVHGTYRYYLTRCGRAAIAACCRLTEFVIVPTLAHTSPRFCALSVNTQLLRD
jgi:DNA-binding transcriptional ArsR family regulator